MPVRGLILAIERESDLIEHAFVDIVAFEHLDDLFDGAAGVQLKREGPKRPKQSDHLHELEVLGRCREPSLDGSELYGVVRRGLRYECEVLDGCLEGFQRMADDAIGIGIVSCKPLIPVFGPDGAALAFGDPMSLGDRGPAQPAGAVGNDAYVAADLFAG